MININITPKLLSVLVVVLFASVLVAPVVADHAGYTIGEDNIHHDRDADYKTEYETHSENPTGEPVIDTPTTLATVENSSPIKGYTPDYRIPDNGLRVFYSEDTDGVNASGSNSSLDGIGNESSLEIRSIDSIAEDSGQNTSGVWAKIIDMPYYTSQSIVEFNGFRLGEYREQQVKSPEFTMGESNVLGPYRDETESNGVIKEAYVGIVGIDSATQPVDTPRDDSEFPLYAGNEGTVYSYLDFEVDESALPEVEVDEPTNTTYQQTQTARTYHIEKINVVRDGIIEGDEETVYYEYAHGAGGAAMNYSDSVNKDVTFVVDGEIRATVEEYSWERTRSRYFDDRTVDVTASKTVTDTASTSVSTRVYHGPNSTGETITGTASQSCSLSESGSTTKTVSRTFKELGGDRSIDIESEETISVSGTISGTCSGEISGTAGPGNFTRIYGTASSEITGTISGTEERTYEYEYWSYWDSKNSTDRGGWTLQDTELERVDTLSIEDKMDARITDNNDVLVNQVSVEVSEDRYHNFVELDYIVEHDGSGPVETGILEEGETWNGDKLNQTYLWSMMMFGDTTFVENDWKSYSQTKYEKAYVANGEGGYEAVRFPNQLGVYLFSENQGPRVTSSHKGNNVHTELIGWKGDMVNVDSDPMDEHVNLSRGKPVIYNTIVVKNAPEPASSLVSIHGTQRDITDSDTKVIPYAKPDVSIERVDAEGPSSGPTEYVIQVTGTRGEPLEGRELRISGGDVEGVRTTNARGEVTVTVPEGITTLQVEVPSDDIRTVVSEDRDQFYGSVTAHRSINRSGTVGHLFDLVYQLMFAIPLILFYLFWRDGKIGA